MKLSKSKFYSICEIHENSKQFTTFAILGGLGPNYTTIHVHLSIFLIYN